MENLKRRQLMCASSGQWKILILAISIGIIILLPGMVVAQEEPGLPIDTTVFVQSRFILWDTTEKMIDKNFNITLISWNITNTYNNYSIQVGNMNYNGTFINHYILNITFNNSIINVLKVTINEKICLYANNVRVVSGVSHAAITNLVETYKIEFLPFELTKFEWNLIWSGVVGVIICLPTAYFTVKYYRKYRGAREV